VLMRLSNAEERVLRMAHNHAYTWRYKDNALENEPESFWLMKLIEEVQELSDSLDGAHHHEPELELCQIAAICLNWLEMRSQS